MLKEEFQYYVDNQNSLFQQYPNKYLIIRDKEVVGAFDTDYWISMIYTTGKE